MNEPDKPRQEPPDPVEVWGRRTGRVLGFVVLFGLALYLLFTYGGGR